MSLTNPDPLRNVKIGRSDWRVKVRVIREWISFSTTGKNFKGFNVLLLDAKNCRMQAYAPANLADKIGRMIEVGKIYLIKNFDVKEYTEKDKFRPVQMDRQIIFTENTKFQDIEESQIFIPKNSFDFFQFSDLKNVASQVTHLADVIGIVPTKEKLNDFTNRHGKPQKNIKFKLSDGSVKINVTFWDSFAEEFYKQIMGAVEEPIILIIASGRVTSFNEHIDICNYAQSQFYVNYDHHSVHKLRKMLKDPAFNKQLQVGKKKSNKLCKVQQIFNLGESFIQDEVVCKLTIKAVKENDKWMYWVCTSCYEKVIIKDDYFFCNPCQRIVPEPNTKFTFDLIGSDETGEIYVRLKDRAVRRLLAGTSFDFESEIMTFPKELKLMIGQGYTIKLEISKDNIENKRNLFIATDIYSGFEYEEPKTHENNEHPQSESYTAQPSSSSCHLDDLSQLEYVSK